MRKNIKGKLPIRPTSNKVVQAIFNILYSVKDKRFLDLFAGTGQVGITALKKGASEVVFVELDRERAMDISQNCRKLGYTEKIKIFPIDVLKFLDNEGDQVYDIVFADPPYDYKYYDKLIGQSLRVLRKGGIFILEHRYNLDFKEKFPEGLYDERVYGDTKLTFWRKE
ncbi:MAG: RsmD family RNA methyltransferase [Hydrogenothermaceae bacterium]|nr:RsmD family RNA methyltransferase [Hydrogenothermaceae bacterium]